MNWKTTWILVGAALALLMYILLVERHQEPASHSGTDPVKLLDLEPQDVQSILLRRTNNLVARLDLTNGFWSMTVPLVYPARSIAISELLKELMLMEAVATISPEEMAELGQSLEDFGLEIPQVGLVIQHNGGRDELALGNETTAGKGVYLKIGQRPEVFVVPSSLLGLIPEDSNQWRSAQLLNLQAFYWDTMEVRTPASSFTLQADVTNQTFFLSAPTPARANMPRIEKMLRTLQSGRIEQFVDDNSQVDLELYGLHQPKAELGFLLGTNVLERFLFGNSPTNRPNLVYVCDLARTNVVLLSLEVLEAIDTSHQTLRETRLFTLNGALVNSVELRGTNEVILQREAEGGWSMDRNGISSAGDSRLMTLFFKLLTMLEGEVERDVASDLNAFGLGQPGLSYRFLTASTNSAGAPTNQLMLQLDFGTVQDEKVYVRRLDESSVYSISRRAYDQLPRQDWQLRNRKVWAFSTNDISRMRIRLPDETVELVRAGPGSWKLGAGSQGVVNSFAVEETMFRLGNLEAEIWLAKGAQNKQRYGFDDQGFRIEIFLKKPADPGILWLEFGAAPENQFPFSMAEVDGHAMIFEFPKKLHFEVLRDLILPFLKDKSQIF